MSRLPTVFQCPAALHAASPTGTPVKFSRCWCASSASAPPLTDAVVRCVRRNRLDRTMLPLIEMHQSGIAEICWRFHVSRLDVSGSAARGSDFDPARSDVDLLCGRSDVSFGSGAPACDNR